MMRIDEAMLLRVLGGYFGEPEIADFLKMLEIQKVPKLKRGEATDILENPQAGVELTFEDAEGLKVSAREYPDGALVLSNVRLYGIDTGTFSPFSGPLPFGLVFGESKESLIRKFDAPAAENPRLRVLRWDRPGHCIFAKLDKNDSLSKLSMQLPVH